MMIKQVIFILMVCLWYPLAWGQQTIEIFSDQAEVDESNQIAIYTGQVVMIHPQWKVNADRLEIHPQTDGSKVIHAYAFPAKIELQDASPQDQQQTKPIYGEAQEIIYHSKLQRLKLSGQARIIREEGEVNAEQLEYWLTRKQLISTTEKQRKQRVFTRINTQ